MLFLSLGIGTERLEFTAPGLIYYDRTHGVYLATE
jgi:hypothetical protein